jgi:adenylate cyclase
MDNYIPSRWTPLYHQSIKKGLRERTQQFNRINRNGKEHRQQITSGLTMPRIDRLDIGEAKRMTAAVLFFDIADFTQTTSELSEDATLSTLNFIIPTVMEIVRTRSGFIEKNTGDGIMAIFGTETKNPLDIAKPAIDAAMMIRYVMNNDLQSNLAQIGLPSLGFRIGIDMGELLIARIGIKNHSFLTAVGDAANRASKLQERAEPNGICIGDKVFHNLPADLELSCESKDDPEWGFCHPGTNIPYRYFNFSHHLEEPIKVIIKPGTRATVPSHPEAAKFQFPPLLPRR